MDLFRDICDEKKVELAMRNASSIDKETAMKFAICANLPDTVRVLMRGTRVNNDILKFAIDERQKRITDIHFDVLVPLLNVVNRFYGIMDTNNSALVKKYINDYNYNCFDNEVKYCIDNDKTNSLDVIISSIGYDYKIEHMIYALERNLNAFSIMLIRLYPNNCNCLHESDFLEDLEFACCDPAVYKIAHNYIHNP